MSKFHKGIAVYTMLFCLFFFGCSSIPSDSSDSYITPDYREYTTGGIFIDKYWSKWGGGKNVKLEGRIQALDTQVMDGKELLLFRLAVPGGLNQVQIFADRKFAQQLFTFRRGDEITVYGLTRVMWQKSRIDQGNVGSELVVVLHKVEKGNLLSGNKQ